MAALEIRVPDIGDFKDVPVIELLVKPGDKVVKEQSLVTLESDKATMEVPSTHTGTVTAAFFSGDEKKVITASGVPVRCKTRWKAFPSNSAS